MEVRIHDLIEIYNHDITKNYRNKKKLYLFDKNRIEYFIEMKKILESGEYNGGIYRIFIVKEPKIRVIMSQSVFDKVINHYIARYIIIPKLEKYLNNRNCATKKNMGLSYAIKVLKRDINKYFYSIDHDILLDMLKKDSTNKRYINKTIENIERKTNMELPRYEYNKGLSIGAMTNQFLAIYYLSKLQHYMIHNLHLKFVNYMDDYVIIHHDKEYLKEVLKIIKKKLKKEYKLEINENKTYIVNIKHGFNFLGYRFILKSKKLIIKLSSNAKKNIKKGIKRNQFLINTKKIEFKKYFTSMKNYIHSYPYVNTKDKINIINRIG